MLSQCLNQGVGIINNTTTNTNSHNKTFNLNVFLNEDCKDAMNLTDFVDSFQLQLSDLESVGDLGYVAGMSKIIVDKLNALDIYKRPIHCTDLKREILHIKDGNKWEKDTGNRRLRHAIKRISKKNSDLLLDWKELHPDVQKPTNRFNDQYLCKSTESIILFIKPLSLNDFKLQRFFLMICTFSKHSIFSQCEI